MAPLEGESRKVNRNFLTKTGKSQKPGGEETVGDVGGNVLKGEKTRAMHK